MKFSPKLILLVTSFCFLTLTQAQLTSFKENNKWGLKNSTGDVVVNAQYDAILGYSYYSLIPVKLNNKFGFLTAEGKLIDEIKYDSVVGHGLYMGYVFLNGKWGLLSQYKKKKDGTNILIAPQYQKIEYSDI